MILSDTCIDPFPVWLPIQEHPVWFLFLRMKASVQPLNSESFEDLYTKGPIYQRRSERTSLG